jgi:hypothetical protein
MDYVMETGQTTISPISFWNPRQEKNSCKSEANTSGECTPCRAQDGSGGHVSLQLEMNWGAQKLTWS